MREAIIEKLGSHLAKDINREADVVYLLVEVRKLFEHDDLPQYPQLRFYRDWVVHTRLSRIHQDDALAEYLKRVNKAVADRQLGSSEEVVSAQITDAISLDRLRDEMITFFQERGLNSHLLEVKQWRNFIKLLIGILADTPLIASNHHDFSLIKEFSFTPSQDETCITGYKVLCTNGATFSGQVFVN